jgi:hypothetical protein
VIDLHTIEEVYLAKEDNDDGCCFNIRIAGEERIFELKAASRADCQRWQVHIY